MSEPARTRLLPLAAAALVWLAGPLAAQAVDTLDLTAVGRDPRWHVAGRTAAVVEVKGKRALELSGGPGDGVVWLDGYDFGDGTIDVDILGRSRPVQGSFVGVAFRVVDAQTHDAVYFRPFNFRAPDSAAHAHALQYVSHPRWTWDVLRTQHPGEYERAVLPELDGDEWLHARIAIRQRTVSVYVNGATAPSLVVRELSDRTGGSVGVWVGNGSGGDFANLRVARAR